jgi:hypothetical protein
VFNIPHGDPFTPEQKSELRKQLEAPPLIWPEEPKQPPTRKDILKDIFLPKQQEAEKMETNTSNIFRGPANAIRSAAEPPAQLAPAQPQAPQESKQSNEEVEAVLQRFYDSLNAATTFMDHQREPLPSPPRMKEEMMKEKEQSPPAL